MWAEHIFAVDFMSRQRPLVKPNNCCWRNKKMDKNLTRKLVGAVNCLAAAAETGKPVLALAWAANGATASQLCSWFCCSFWKPEEIEKETGRIGKRGPQLVRQGSNCRFNCVTAKQLIALSCRLRVPERESEAEELEAAHHPAVTFINRKPKVLEFSISHATEMLCSTLARWTPPWWRLVNCTWCTLMTSTWCTLVTSTWCRCANGNPACAGSQSSKNLGKSKALNVRARREVGKDLILKYNSFNSLIRL